tara:strand:+ start:3095 stop:3472 length:378 start_codon:yes stop_codon:yes gene_type:complete
MTKKRLTYVPMEIIKAMPDIVAKGKDGTLSSAKIKFQTGDIIKIKTHQFDILAIIKLLYAVRKAPLSFSKLYVESQIRMKKSFLNYLHFAVKHGFLHRWEYTNTTQYGISNNGLKFLKLLGVNDV